MSVCLKYDRATTDKTFDDLMARMKAGVVSTPTGLGTVFDLAKQGGWRPKHSSDSAGFDLRGTSGNEEGGALGDIRAGRLFTKAMKDKLRFVAPRNCWLKWNGTVWEWCNKGEEMQAAKKVADKILDHATAQYKVDPERNRKAMAWALAQQGIKRLEAMIELAKSEEVPAC